MTLETEIYARLSGYSGMSEIVGTRIYPVVVPQNADMPSISFQRISSVAIHAFGDDIGVKRTRIQVTVFADQFAVAGQAVAVRDKVFAALSRYRGGTIQDCLFENEQQDYESAPSFYRIILDFIFWHEE